MGEEKLKVYDALGCLYIHAFRVAKANNQSSEQSKPYIVQEQIQELIQKILEQQGIDPKNLIPTQPEERMDDEKLEKLQVYDALGCLSHLAFRLGKANNQWADEDHPYVTLPQIWELIERVLENPSLSDSKDPPPYDIRLRLG